MCHSFVFVLKSIPYCYNNQNRQMIVYIKE